MIDLLKRSRQLYFLVRYISILHFDAFGEEIWYWLSVCKNVKISYLSNGRFDYMIKEGEIASISDTNCICSSLLKINWKTKKTQKINKINQKHKIIISNDYQLYKLPNFGKCSKTTIHQPLRRLYWNNWPIPSRTAPYWLPDHFSTFTSKSRLILTDREGVAPLPPPRPPPSWGH